MLRNFKLTVEYDGTDFCGWQIQANGERTIQGHLEDKIYRIFKKKIHCIASGRTDSGVHALAQVIHFKVDTDMKPAHIHRALTAFLDRDIAVLKVQEVPLDFHAQYSVKCKTYCYTILNRSSRSAMLRNRVLFYPHDLNLNLMRKAARDLKGKHDFRCFQAASERSPVKDTVRTISRLTITKDGDFIHISITANGFLYKMVRNIVGALIMIGREKLPVSIIKQLLKAKDRKLSPPTAQPQGLCLISVRY